MLVALVLLFIQNYASCSCLLLLYCCSYRTTVAVLAWCSCIAVLRELELLFLLVAPVLLFIQMFSLVAPGLLFIQMFLLVAPVMLFIQNYGCSCIVVHTDVLTCCSWIVVHTDVLTCCSCNVVHTELRLLFLLLFLLHCGSFLCCYSCSFVFSLFLEQIN